MLKPKKFGEMMNWGFCFVDGAKTNVKCQAMATLPCADGSQTSGQKSNMSNSLGNWVSLLFKTRLKSAAAACGFEVVCMEFPEVWVKFDNFKRFLVWGHFLKKFR